MAVSKVIDPRGTHHGGAYALCFSSLIFFQNEHLSVVIVTLFKCQTLAQL